MIPESFLSHIPEIRDGFLFEETEDGAMLYESSTGKVITLDRAADLILSHCADGLSVKEITEKITSEFSMGRDEVLQGLTSLRDHGIF
jgi:hypothetical protein